MKVQLECRDCRFHINQLDVTKFKKEFMMIQSSEPQENKTNITGHSKSKAWMSFGSCPLNQTKFIIDFELLRRIDLLQSFQFQLLRLSSQRSLLKGVDLKLEENLMSKVIQNYIY